MTIEIKEIIDPILDAQLVSDEIALLLERKGSLKFKVIAYRMLQDIMRAGALGVEIVLSGKLPSDRSRSWRFSHGYLKKTGSEVKLVEFGKASAYPKAGAIGLRLSIVRPGTKFSDKIDYNEFKIYKELYYELQNRSGTLPMDLSSLIFEIEKSIESHP